MFVKNRLGLLVLTLMIFGAMASLSHAQDTATFIMPDGSLTFDYPPDWEAEDHGTRIVVTNNPATLEVGSRSLQPNDALMMIYGATELSLLGIEGQQSPQDALGLLAQQIGTQLNVGATTQFDVNGQPAARLDFTGNTLEGFFLVLQVSDGHLLTMVANASDLSAFETEFMAIVESVTYDAEQVGSVPNRLTLEAHFGPADAPVTIYEFGTYGCQSCRFAHQSGYVSDVQALVEAPAFVGQVRYVYVNFPVILPDVDPISAEVAQCVLDQGQEAFWTFHDAIFDDVSDFEYSQMRTPEAFVAFAEERGLDGDALQSCMDARTHRGTVQFNLNRALQVGVRATPTMFINDQVLQLFTPLDQIESIIQAELGN